MVIHLTHRKVKLKKHNIVQMSSTSPLTGLNPIEAIFNGFPVISRTKLHGYWFSSGQDFQQL